MHAPTQVPCIASCDRARTPSYNSVDGSKQAHVRVHYCASLRCVWARACMMALWYACVCACVCVHVRVCAATTITPATK